MMRCPRWIRLGLLASVLSWNQAAGQVRPRDANRREIKYAGVDLNHPSGLRLESPPRLTITDASGCQFNGVRGIVVQQTGGLVAANSGNDELCVFDERGKLTYRRGRTGEGPGEYQAIFGLLPMAGDSLLVFDAGLRRLSILDSTAQFVRSFLLTPPDHRLGSIERVAVAGDGSVLVGYSDFVRGPPGPTAVQSTMQLFRYDSEGKLLNRLGQFLSGEHFVLELPINIGGVGYRDLAFGRQLSLAPLQDGFVAADGTDSRIPQYAVDGSVAAVHHLDQEVRPVTKADIDAYRRSHLGTLQGDRLRFVERLLADMPYPTTYPAFRTLLADPTGRIWMQSFPQPGAPRELWIVLDPRTRRSSLLVAPPRFRILAVSDVQVCGLSNDEFDVARIECFRVRQG